MTASKKTRIESDSLGEIEIPDDKYYGAQTQRSLHNFPLGDEIMPLEVIFAMTSIKKAAALTHKKLDLLSAEKAKAIVQACDEILDHQYDDQFPLSVWQSGSGTQSHMNVNEVVAHRANEILTGEKSAKEPVHPNDHVNKSQSTNDVFSSAMQIAALALIAGQLSPALETLKSALDEKAKTFSDIITVGRTHMGDAVPLFLGQRFSAYVDQIRQCSDIINAGSNRLGEIPIGGTAIGTGINAPEHYVSHMIHHLNEITRLPIRHSNNCFSHQAAHDVLVETAGHLNTLASALIKIANDFRLMSSGPRCGFHEITLPANEPGSSIMPGKVNPTQCEALIMVALRVQGNHTTISFSGSLGNFEAHSFRPVMIDSLIQSIRLLSSSMGSFSERCVTGIEANTEKIARDVDKSLALATVLNTKLGYEAASKIAKKAFAENKTLKTSAVELSLLSEAECDELLDPKKMI